MLNKMTTVCLVVIGAALVGCSTPSQSDKPANEKSTSTSVSASAPASSSAAPKEALDAIRGAGVQGDDTSINDLISIVCVFSDGSKIKTKADLATQLTQGGKLTEQQAGVVIDTALKYSCPENAGKLNK